MIFEFLEISMEVKTNSECLMAVLADWMSVDPPMKTQIFNPKM